MEGHGTAVRYAVHDGIASISLESPPLNILTTAMMSELAAGLDRAAADTSIKAVALTANGKAFSAGADVGEHRPEQVRDMIGAFSRLFRAFDALEVPVAMAVRGAALGAGFELAMMADVLIASEKATFGQPEIRLGFFAPVGVARLPALCGPAKAIEITCSGRVYSAAEMLAMGIVSRVVPDEEVDAALEAFLADVRRASPLILRMNVRMVKRSLGRPFAEALAAAERVFLDELMATADVREGIASFFEKRRPVWANR